MISRKNFLKMSALSGMAPMGKWSIDSPSQTTEINKPLVISTWQHGIPANEAAWKVLTENGYALDAVEAGVRIPEADPDVRTVGYGGLPRPRRDCYP